MHLTLCYQFIETFGISNCIRHSNRASETSTSRARG